MGTELKIDEIGNWSEVKLAILEEYAKPFSQILRARNLRPIYIDGFAGAGHHKAKGSDRIIEGSPARALAVDPAFELFYFIDLDGKRVAQLKNIASGRSNVFISHGDCNRILTTEIFPKIRYENFQRALCILDPYGLHLNWETVFMAGKSDVIEIFLNFPVMDMNMNVLKHNPDRVPQTQKERMTKFWGDESWMQAAYSPTRGLFEEMQEKNTIEPVVKAYQERLKKIAGFKYVPEPMPMRNSKGAIVYFLFFAAQKPVASDIVKFIFNKYDRRGEIKNG